jgi:hypothetical protein
MGLRALGAQVTAVRVYQYALPENLEPLREAARKLAAGAFDVTLWTTSTQLIHLLEVAEQLGIAAAVREGVRKSISPPLVPPPARPWWSTVSRWLWSLRIPSSGCW